MQCLFWMALFLDEQRFADTLFLFMGTLERFLNWRGLAFAILSQEGTPLAVLPGNTQCLALTERSAGRGGSLDSRLRGDFFVHRNT